MLRAVLGGNVAGGLSSRPALVKGVDETIEDMMTGRDIAVLGKGLKVGIAPAIKQMAMCGSGWRGRAPRSSSGPPFVLELGHRALERAEPGLKWIHALLDDRQDREGEDGARERAGEEEDDPPPLRPSFLVL